jgi:hypothetical protein
MTSASLIPIALGLGLITAAIVGLAAILARLLPLLRELVELIRDAVDQLDDDQAAELVTAEVVDTTDQDAPQQPRHRLGDDQLTTPPMIGDVTMYQWLTRHHPTRDNAWANVVAEFYNRAATVPAVFAYFGHRDDAGQWQPLTPAEWQRLQSHFTRALILVTHTGVTGRLLRNLEERHADVRDADGNPITAEIYAAVVSTLLGVLRDYDVPEAGLRSLADTIQPFRSALVRD